MEKPIGFAICQSAPAQVPGYVSGYFCKICSEPLHLSSRAVDALATLELITLCRTCGLAMQQRVTDAKIPQTILRSSNDEWAAVIEQIKQLRKARKN